MQSKAWCSQYINYIVEAYENAKSVLTLCAGQPSELL